MDTQQTSCNQCGVCCTKGGAALHSSDIALLSKGIIPRKNLITIRKGEFAFNPVVNRVEATLDEIVKLKGTGKEWTCCYYDPQTQGCTIYETRPMACGVLKCWNPEDSLALVGKDLLSRVDILQGDGTLTDLVLEYDLACPLPDCTKLTRKLSGKTLKSLEDAINKDLRFRDRVVAQSAQILEEEMFLFGRPLFQLLHPLGFSVMQSGNRLCLRQTGK